MIHKHATGQRWTQSRKQVDTVEGKGKVSMLATGGKGGHSKLGGGREDEGAPHSATMVGSFTPELRRFCPRDLKRLT